MDISGATILPATGSKQNAISVEVPRDTVRLFGPNSHCLFRALLGSKADFVA